MSNLSEYLADAKGDQSIDAIAKRATDAGHSISRSVVAKYLRGEHGSRPPEATLLGLAAGFRVDVRELRELAGRPAGELGPYQPPAISASLTPKQRDALDNLIQAIVIGDSDGRQPEAEKIPVTQWDQTALAARRHRGAKDRIRARDDEGGMEPA